MINPRRWPLAVAVATTGLLLVSGLNAGVAQAAGTTWQTAKVERWIDGDTVQTSAGRIRLIGIDTPERGKCGANSATRLARKIAPVGSTIRLGNPTSVIDVDRYGRKLRYVDSGKRDIGAAQIRAGAKARYDSVDGYDHHPRQSKYRSLDRKHRNYKCSSGSSGGSSNSDSNDSESTYNGPRCYAPGGKTWRPC